MSKEIILIEGFGKNLDLLKEAAVKAGTKALVATDVEAAQKLIGPDTGLVILDISNPDTSRLDLSALGYTDPKEFVEKTVKDTHSCVKQNKCGILAILADEGEVERFAALGVKFDNYLVQPYSPKELNMRVQNALGKSPRTKFPGAVKMKTDRLKIELLKNILDDGITVIHPAADPQSPTGYTYPELRNFLDMDVAGIDEILEDLTERACLERKLHDKIHICPTCNRYNINFRETCPACHSIDIELQEMIHHFACGYVGPISQYQQGLKLVCPKCRAELRHIGLDYEKPTETFLCNANGHVFTDPALEAYCLARGDRFDPKDLYLKNVYSYTITGRAEDAVQAGTIEPAEIDPVLLDTHLGIYHYAFLQRQLDTEISRSKRYGHRLSLVVIGLDYYDDYVSKLGRSEALGYLRILAQTVREMIRMSDIPARFDKDKIIILLSETPPDGAASFTHRLRERLKEVKVSRTDVKLSFSTGISAYPDLGETAEEITEGAKNAYNRARNSGKETIAEKPAK